MLISKKRNKAKEIRKNIFKQLYDFKFENSIFIKYNFNEKIIEEEEDIDKMILEILKLDIKNNNFIIYLASINKKIKDCNYERYTIFLEFLINNYYNFNTNDNEFLLINITIKKILFYNRDFYKENMVYNFILNLINSEFNCVLIENECNIFCIILNFLIYHKYSNNILNYILNNTQFIQKFILKIKSILIKLNENYFIEIDFLESIIGLTYIVFLYLITNIEVFDLLYHLCKKSNNNNNNIYYIDSLLLIFNDNNFNNNDNFYDYFIEHKLYLNFDNSFKFLKIVYFSLVYYKNNQHILKNVYKNIFKSILINIVYNLKNNELNEKNIIYIFKIINIFIYNYNSDKLFNKLQDYFNDIIVLYCKQSNNIKIEVINIYINWTKWKLFDIEFENILFIILNSEYDINNNDMVFVKIVEFLDILSRFLDINKIIKKNVLFNNEIFLNIMKNSNLEIELN